MQDERLHRAILNSMGDAVHVVDRNFRITFANDALKKWNRELGLPADVLGRTPFALYPFLPDSVQQEFAEVFETGKTFVKEETLQVNGIGLTTETRKIPMFDGGAVTSVLTMIRDVTARKRAEAEYRELAARVHETQRAESLARLAGGVAHDFNNLLTGILGNTELALAAPAVPDALRPLLEDIREAANRAAELSTRMLAYSGKGRFRVARIDLNQVVRELDDSIRVRAPDPVTLEHRLARDLPPIRADRAQIRQALAHLVTNAIEALADGRGTVTISTGKTRIEPETPNDDYDTEPMPPGPCISLRVHDTGPGMDPETRARMFDPFFSTKFFGRGLGLSAVLGIARGHGGAVRVETEPGRGTAVELLLPCTTNGA
jgi:PAS domain S-box-containing protein